LRLELELAERLLVRKAPRVVGSSESFVHIRFFPV